MASLSKDGKSWRIRFVDADGKRHGIRLPGLKKSEANTVLERCKELIAARISNQGLQTVTATWLAGIDDRLRKRLEVVGLVDAAPIELETDELLPAPTLREFLESFLKRGRTKAGHKASRETRNKWKGTKDLLLECFDGERRLDSFTLAEGREFRDWMEKRTIPKTARNPSGRMEESSIRQRISNCKTFWNYAVSEEMTDSNPFRTQHSSSVQGKGKIHIPAEVADKCIEAAPDAQWRLLIALWRYAGLRKMEPISLTWGDVLWSEGKLRVHSTKTSHHEGKGVRYVPIRDVESYLLDVAELAEDQTPNARIINRYAETMSNLHKPFATIVEDAGIELWPNLFKNLRQSCENDWLTNREAPKHVIAAWMGHSVQTQDSYYAMVSEGHFETFNNRAVESGPFRGPVDHGKDSQGSASGPDNGPKSLAKAKSQHKHYSKMLPQGLEP